MSSMACVPSVPNDGLFFILAARKLVSFAVVIRVVSGGEALRDDPSNGCEGDYARHFGVKQENRRSRGWWGESCYTGYVQYDQKQKLSGGCISDWTALHKKYYHLNNLKLFFCFT